ncbi:MAG: NADH-quinone oxidoreductase subunit J [Planctomycetota bacterium]
METSTYYAIAFWCFAAMSIIPALAILFSKEIVRMAFWLLATLSSFSGFYLLLGADFLAIAQLMVYVGGILILILFGIMLTKRTAVNSKPFSLWESYSAIGLIAFLVLFLGMVQMAKYTSWLGAESLIKTGTSPETQKPYELPEPLPTVRSLGFLLMTDFLLPFEISSVLLLAALTGAAYVIRRRDVT